MLQWCPPQRAERRLIPLAFAAGLSPRGTRLALYGSMRGNRKQQPAIYVVYPAALFDGWEVVMEHDETPVRFDSRASATAYANARAAACGGALVKVENWFGDMESMWEVRAPSGSNQSTLSMS
jgi:hypothetical protein